MKTPHQYQEERDSATALYSQALETLEGVLAIKPHRWGELRETAKSDKAADRLWEASPEGITEMRMKLLIKRLEKVISTARTGLEVLAGEARNQW